MEVIVAFLLGIFARDWIKKIDLRGDLGVMQPPDYLLFYGDVPIRCNLCGWRGKGHEVRGGEREGMCPGCGHKNW